MIDLASYRDLKEQIETLKNEVASFSEKLGTSRYAIALTRTDIVPHEEINEKISEFITMLDLEPSKSSEFDFDKELPYYIQESADESLGYEIEKPYFILPISSAINKNIEPLKYALFNLVHESRK
jgi:GTP-binding protein